MNVASPTAEMPTAATAGVLIQLIDAAVIAAGDAVRVEGINWSISAGDYWVVGGPPGAGKSDLLAVLAGLYRPVRGRLRLFGNDIAALSEDDSLAARRRIGLVFENGGRLFHHLTVAENVALPLRYHHNWSAAEAEERVNEVLKATGLSRTANDTPGQLKHPLRQRVGLARALAMRPEVVLFDNPLAGLGPAESRWWIDFLSRLSAGHDLMARRPATLVVSCHDLRPWVNHATRFAMLKQNQWLLIGGSSELAGSDEPLLRELLAVFSAGQPGD